MDNQDWTYYGISDFPTPCLLGSCYVFIQDSLTWSGAREVCIQQGGDLVSIQTQEENTFLANHASPQWPDKCQTSTGLRRQCRWVSNPSIQSSACHAKGCCFDGTRTILRERCFYPELDDANGFVSKYWTSGRDEFQSGTWKWAATGATFDFTLWADGQPDGIIKPNDTVVVLRHLLTDDGEEDDLWLWHDWSEHTELGAICEITPSP